MSAAERAAPAGPGARGVFADQVGPDVAPFLRRLVEVLVRLRVDSAGEEPSIR